MHVCTSHCEYIVVRFSTAFVASPKSFDVKQFLVIFILLMVTFFCTSTTLLIGTKSQHIHGDSYISSLHKDNTHCDMTVLPQYTDSGFLGTDINHFSHNVSSHLKSSRNLLAFGYFFILANLRSVFLPTRPDCIPRSIPLFLFDSSTVNDFAVFPSTICSLSRYVRKLVPKAFSHQAQRELLM